MAGDDFSHLSDEELATIASSKSTAPTNDYSHISDEELAQIASQANPTSAGETYAQHAANVGTLNYLPNIVGYGTKKIAELQDYLNPDRTPVAPQVNQQDIANQTQADLTSGRQQHPAAAFMGDLTGGVGAATLASGGLGAMGQLAGPGFIQAPQVGALLGVAEKPAGEDTAGNRLANMTTGGIGGLAGYGLGKAVGGATSGALGALTHGEEKAAEKAVKSTGAYFKDFKGLDYRNEIEPVGKMLLDEKIVEPGDTVKSIAQKLSTKTEQYGNEIRNYLSQAQAVTKNPGTSFVNPQNIVTKIETEVIPNLDPTSDRAIIDVLQNEADLLKSRGKSLDFDQAQRLKKGYDKQVNFKKLQPESQEAVKLVRGLVNEEMESGLDQAGKSFGDTEMGQKYIDAKNKFHLLTQAEDIAHERVLRDASGRVISPSDYIAGIGGGIVGAGTGHSTTDQIERGIVGTAVGAVNHFARTHGNPVLANVYRGLENYGVSPAAELFQGLNNQTMRRAAGTPASGVGLYEALKGLPPVSLFRK